MLQKHLEFEEIETKGRVMRGKHQFRSSLVFLLNESTPQEDFEFAVRQNDIKAKQNNLLDH